MPRWLPVALALAVSLAGPAGALSGLAPAGPLAAALFGSSIIGAGFLLSWIAQVLQLSVSQGLALALLALVAVLPEYAVDATFAWLAARQPEYASYALANMTGANRLLVGVGWPLVIILTWWRRRDRQVALAPEQRLKVIALLAGTFYAFTIVPRDGLYWFDGVILAGIFGGYIWAVARQRAHEPDLAGPEAWMAERAPRRRWALVAGVSIAAAGSILVIAEPFARALVATGRTLGLSEFLVVQWLAPLASEMPELVVLTLLAWRRRSREALATLVSSKINQWTLLIAILPFVYAISLGDLQALPIDERQREELFLTAAQSLLAATLLLDLRLSVRGAVLLAGLFFGQFVWIEARVPLGMVYLGLAAVTLVRERRDAKKLFFITAET